MDGARGRARAAILPRVHLSRENHECQFFIGNREEKVVRGWRAWARPRGNSAVRPFEKVGRWEEGGEGSAWVARVGAPARQSRRASI